ncbi:MAG: sugar porter family MFS transporter [Rhodopirellula sp. JB053]
MGNATSYNLGYLFRISLVAALGGLLFGYDWVVIGGAKAFYEPYFDLVGEDKAWMSGWAMSSALAGCLGGAIVSGAITDSIGRKKVLIIAAILFTASAIWTACSYRFFVFIIARILGGIGIGLASNVSPIYIAEVSPSSLRGRFVSMNQLTIVIGVLAAQIVNLLIYNYAPVDREATTDVILASWNGQYGWRWMFAAETVPAGLFFLLALVIPESPRWLLQNGRKEQAEKVLHKIGGEEYASEQIASINESFSEETSRHSIRDLFEPRLMKIIGLGIFIAMFQQWCGINVIFNYAQEIFEAAGYDVSGMMLNIVITGIVNLVFTLVAINTVDRWGRRPLMLLGSGGLMVTYAILGSCYYFELKGIIVLAVVLTAIACYAMTLAPITWVLLSEIFPNRVRGTAISLCVSALWIACFVLTVTFKPINVALGASGTFWLYGVICLIGFLVLYARVPETKNKSLEEIERELT